MNFFQLLDFLENFQHVVQIYQRIFLKNNSYIVCNQTGLTPDFIFHFLVFEKKIK